METRISLAKDRTNTYDILLHDKKNLGLYLFVIEGNVQIDDHILSRRDAVAITTLTDTDLLTIHASSQSDLLLFEIPLS